VDADKVEASFTNGVLTVNLPKNPKAKDKTAASRRIRIISDHDHFCLGVIMVLLSDRCGAVKGTPHQTDCRKE